jgi:hypothetical protein
MSYNLDAGPLFSEGAAAEVVAVAVCVDVAGAELSHAPVACASRKSPAWIASFELTAAASILIQRDRLAHGPLTVSASLLAELHVAVDWGWG